jgi:hypothetical protein
VPKTAKNCAEALILDQPRSEVTKKAQEDLRISAVDATPDVQTSREISDTAPRKGKRP